VPVGFRTPTIPWPGPMPWPTPAPSPTPRQCRASRSGSITRIKV
jgi:hypothetical protein